MNGLDIFHIITFAVLIIVGIIELNWIIVFSILWSKDYTIIKKRKPKIVIFIGILSILCTLYDRIAMNICSNYFLQNCYPLWRVVDQILVTSAAAALPIIISARSWLVLYDIRWNLELEDRQWRQSVNSIEKTWYLENRQKYGKDKNIVLFTIIFVLIWIVIGTSLLIYYNEFNFYTRLPIGILSTCGLIICILLYSQYRKMIFKDVWGVKNEITVTLITTFIGIIIFLLLGLILKAQPP
eukprot:80197_1